MNKDTGSVQVHVQFSATKQRLTVLSRVTSGGSGAAVILPSRKVGTVGSNHTTVGDLVGTEALEEAGIGMCQLDRSGITVLQHVYSPGYHSLDRHSRTCWYRKT